MQKSPFQPCSNPIWKKINSGAIPNSLKVAALFLYFFTALGKTRKHAMVLHNGKGTRARNLNTYLHRNPPEADQVSAPEPSRTATGICSGTLRNLTRYLHWNPPDPHQVSQPTWIDTNAIMLDDMLLLTVYDLVLCSSSWHHAHIVIQSYTYKHTHTNLQWCYTRV